MSVQVEHGDCLEVMERLADEGVQVESVVTDPPYHLTSIVKRFGKDGSAPAKSNGATGVYGRATAGFMGQKWDGGDIAFRPETWQLVMALLKPGGHMLVFGGTRTFHRVACAIEDAGFEIRDAIMWHYGSGFPKSHSVSKAIGRAAGAEREKVRSDKNFGRSRLDDGKTTFGDYAGQWDITVPATEAAKQWDGWGTALKPATEIICLVRKPLSEATVAANVLRWGTGALNIDGCRVEGQIPAFDYFETGSKRGYDGGIKGGARTGKQREGRWPANVIHDGSEEVLEAFARFGNTGGGIPTKGNSDSTANVYGDYEKRSLIGHLDKGTAARFFYCAKAGINDRVTTCSVCGTQQIGGRTCNCTDDEGKPACQRGHPTVKPVDLIAYLCRLITPPKGTVLDPFAGSGTTAMAALREGFDAILIEKEARFVADIKRRLAHVEGADTPLFQGVAP